MFNIVFASIILVWTSELRSPVTIKRFASAALAVLGILSSTGSL
jgi:hypothetical protein